MTTTSGRTRILFGYADHSAGVADWYRDIAGAAGDGAEVRLFCVTVDPPRPRLSWRELDARWRAREKKLMALYGRLRKEAFECDVFLLYNGANIHPELLAYLPTFNVYCCFDDPESSADVSAPVAASFDAAFHGNIASRFQYESWGCRRLAWLPIFTTPRDVPPRGAMEELISRRRDIDISLVCGKNNFRRRRLERLAEAFPAARCHGSGWAAGPIGPEALGDLYRRSKIGWNVHNSTGPINRRLFALPAHGVLQICDNKTGLGEIFALGREAAGFDTISEAVALTRHYLERDDERREIAAAGLSRYWRDYHAGAIWERIRRQLDEWGAAPRKAPVPSLPGRRFSFPDPVRRAREGAGRLAGAVRALRAVPAAADAGARPSPRAGVDESVALSETVAFYRENPEMRGVNMARERLARGEPFEWPNMLALNWAVTALIGKARRIVEIGSGTGPFARFAAVDPRRTIHCIEEDDFARDWARTHRSPGNVRYLKGQAEGLEEGYDLLVSIDVVEHVSDLRAFLSFCARRAPRAVFTTPNREVVRAPGDAGPPPYPPHVREFDGGEFYWLLKQHYSEVSLYFMPDVYVPWLEPMTIATRGTPLVAVCAGPLVPGSDEA